MRRGCPEAYSLGFISGPAPAFSVQRDTPLPCYSSGFGLWDGTVYSAAKHQVLLESVDFKLKNFL